MPAEIVMDDKRAIERAMGPMQMIQIAFQKAVESGGPEALAVADRILEQMAKQRDYEDRDRFNASLLRIQTELKPVVKRGWNDSTKSSFALVQDVDAAIAGLMRQEGMSLTFEPELNPQPNMVTIIGILSQGAYSRRYPLPMPCDGQGAKGGGVMSRTHATGSAATYAKRYLKNLIFDLSFKEKDDDGNAAGVGIEELSQEQFAPLKDAIEGATKISEVTSAYISALKAAKNDREKAAFEAAANKRKGELR
jgi:hypothetical protein